MPAPAEQPDRPEERQNADSDHIAEADDRRVRYPVRHHEKQQQRQKALRSGQFLPPLPRTECRI